MYNICLKKMQEAPCWISLVSNKWINKHYWSCCFFFVVAGALEIEKYEDLFVVYVQVMKNIVILDLFSVVKVTFEK